MWHFLFFLALAVAVLYGLPRKFKRDKPVVEAPVETKKPEQPFLMKMYGGPVDGQIEKIVEAERPLFFVMPYAPKPDENGMPPEENIIGHMHGKLYARPNYAYYRHVLDDEYVYVRDLAEKEVQRIAMTGDLPEAKPFDPNADEEG